MLKRVISRLRGERGDTLIEVTFALGIMATVLVSSMFIATKAFQLGTTARYRTQLINAAVEQAEGLRSYRDNTPVWGTFASTAAGAATSACTLPADLGHNCFAMTINGGKWQPTNVVSAASSTYTAGTIPTGTVIEIRNVGAGAAINCAMKFEVHYGSPSILTVGTLNYNEGEITVELVNENYKSAGGYANCQP